MQRLPDLVRGIVLRRLAGERQEDAGDPNLPLDVLVRFGAAGL